jgi:hypothetical protein
MAARGQSQDSQSVAEAARRSREQKKATSKSAPVVTDDTIKPAAPTAPAASPDTNVPAGNSTPAPAPATDATPPAAPEDAQKKTKDAAELATLKLQLAEAQKGLDLLQRESALQQDTFYSNPAHDRDTAGKAKLDAMKQVILDKQQEVDALKARLAALQESLGGAAPATPSTPPPSPQS